jgi:hypothetical protein
LPVTRSAEPTKEHITLEIRCAEGRALKLTIPSWLIFRADEVIR